MRDKATDNIEAAKLLVNNSFYDSSASRAYYAVYHIAWYFLTKKGRKPDRKAQDGSYYWSHRSIPKILFEEFKFINDDKRIEWELICSLRTRADYYPENIEREEARISFQIAEDLINLFLSKEWMIE